LFSLLCFLKNYCIPEAIFDLEVFSLGSVKVKGLRMKIIGVSGSPFPNGTTQKALQVVLNTCQKADCQTELIDLAGRDIPRVPAKNAVIEEIQAKLLESDAVVIASPEFNASVPGLLKDTIDAMRYPDTFKGKPIALIANGGGVNGGLGALAHLSDILKKFGAFVLPQQVSVGKLDIVEDLADKSKKELTPVIIQHLEQMAAGLVELTKKLKGNN
jgi:chromate reductase, NAD(P)H dehydrogenase (quinone)